MSAAERHYKAAENYLRAGSTTTVNLDAEPHEQLHDHLTRVELLLGGIVHALLFVGCVEATRPATGPLTKTDGSLRKTLAED